MIRQQTLFFTGLITCFMIMAAQTYAADCKASPQMGMGTHFKPITQHKIDIGQGLKVKGVILSAQSCIPIENARIEHWQMNTEGSYVDRLRAYLYSDLEGAYRFETEWPGARVPHIHLISVSRVTERLSPNGWEENVSRRSISILCSNQLMSEMPSIR